MPRAFCPECGTEVPVDPDGVCHVGHVVDLGSANIRDDELAAPLTGTPSEDTDEPEPWVASVDATTLGGHTPPPDTPADTPQPPPPASTDRAADGPSDRSGVSAPSGLPLPPSSPASPPPAASAVPAPPAYQPAEDGPDVTPGAPDVGGSDDDVHEVAAADDLASAASAAAASLEPEHDHRPDGDGDVLGWTPPTTSPVGGAPIPPPAPVDRPDAPGGGEVLSGDFDLDDLEAAVTELSNDAPPTAPPSPPPAPAPGDGDQDDLDLLSSFSDDADDAPAPAPPPAPPAPEHRLPPPASADAAVSEDTDAAAEAEEVDLSNFTARGSSDKKRGGLFKRR